MLTDDIDNIKEEIEGLSRYENYHYEIDIIKQRDNAEAISQELSKYGM